MPPVVMLTVMSVDLDAMAAALEDTTGHGFGKFGVRCKTCQLLLDLPALGVDPRADLIRSYIDGPVEAEVVAEKLRKGGAVIGGDSLRRHRRGACKTRQAVEQRGAA